MADDQKYNDKNSLVNNSRGGYPKTTGPNSSIYVSPENQTLKTAQHFVNRTNNQPQKDKGTTTKFFVEDVREHFTKPSFLGTGKDYSTWESANKRLDESINSSYMANAKDGKYEVPVFQGATTNINPTNDPEIKKILDNGGFGEDNESKVSSNNARTPISPIHPFLRMQTNSKTGYNASQIATLTTYNRTSLPVADLEWRKGFRYIFITRPECYIMATENGKLVLSEQAENDEDFGSCYTRMPHILKLLSPIYVTGSFSSNSLDSNWNYLLSNRAMGAPIAQTSLSINENVAKSITGYTVTPGMTVDSLQGSTIDVSFRDTKNLEVSEMIRMWMMYIHKIKRGIFAPSFNGYQRHNAFDSDMPDGGKPVYKDIHRYHIYNRALDYCASMFDIITNESGTKILYWCKYYGIYPTTMTPDGLTNDKAGPITNEQNVNVTFKYHRKSVNLNRNLIEFNYNAGITDDIGRVINKDLLSSESFLIKNDKSDSILPRYIGPAGMFCASPYIVMEVTQRDPLDPSTSIVTPQLRFSPITNSLDTMLNMGLTSVSQETSNIMGTQPRVDYRL